MDIKGLIRSTIPFTAKAERPDAQAEARSKTDASGDRDGNGQQSSGEERNEKHYTPEETQEVIKHLESLAGVKDNGLTIRAVITDGTNVIYIQDRNGKTVRRIPESDFESLKAKEPRKSGNLLNKKF